MARIHYINDVTASGTLSKWLDVSEVSSIAIGLKTDTTGTLYVYYSPDANNVDSTLTFSIASGVREVHIFKNTSSYCRIGFTYSVAPTYYRCEILGGDYTALNNSANATVQQDIDSTVVKPLDQELLIAKKLFDGIRVINKFGRNSDVDAAEDIWDGGGDYTGFPTGAAENIEVLSSSVNDTAAGTGARTLRVYYLDSDYNAFDSSENFLYVDVILNGTTPVSTTKTGVRVWRSEVLTAGSGTTNAGTITIRHTSTTANIFTVIPVGYGQSEITAFTIPLGYTGYLKQYRCGILDTTSNSALIAIKMRPFGGAVRLQRSFSIDTTAFMPYLQPYGMIKFEEKTDFCLRVVSIGNSNGNVTGAWSLVLVKN